MKIYLVYKDLCIEGMDENSVKVFKHKRDAVCYSLALKTDKYYPDYVGVEILELDLI